MLFVKKSLTTVTHQPLKKQRLLAALTLAAAAINANATPVSVTADFSLFTVDVLSSPTPPITVGEIVTGMNERGLSVNGHSIDICDTDPSCSGIFNTGVAIGLTGSSVSFGYDFADYLHENNAFSFVGNTEDVAGTGSQNQFKLGTITFTNGGFFYFWRAHLDFTLTTHSSNANLDNHTFSGSILLDVKVSNTRDPIENADYFTVQDSQGNILTDLGSVRVYDNGICPVGDPSAPNCNTGSVDLFGHINSLHLDLFANPTGGAFVNSSTDPNLNSVPEPNTLLLSCLGLVGFGVARRYRNRTID